jgi:Cytochrome c554 and c-prime
MRYHCSRIVFITLIVLLGAGAAFMGACHGADEPAEPEVASAAPSASSPAISLPRTMELRPHAKGARQVIRVEPGETEALIIYSGVTHGTIASCGCETNPTGGLMKELTLLGWLRRPGRPSLFVHPGDLFPFEKKPGKAEYIAKAASLMGYDALCLGEQELVEGLDTFRKLAAKYRLPYLSENLIDGTGKPVAPGHVIKDLAGIKVGIVSIFSDQRYLFLDDAFTKEVIPQPAVAALDRALGQLEGKVDFLVLLSHQDKYLDRELAIKFPQINLIIGGHDEEMLPSPIRIGRTLICNAGILGERLGVVYLAVNPDRHVRVLGHEFMPTTAPVPKHPKVEAVYREYVKATGAKAEDNDPVLPARFESARSCRPCHEAIYESYLKTPHARAWQTLVRVGRADDKVCQPCHAMGAGRPDGFRNIRQTPGLAGVSCQACHPMTSDHRKRGVNDPLEYAQSERTCQQCHTRTTSPNFNFWEQADEIDHHEIKPKTAAPPKGWKPKAIERPRKDPYVLKKRR